MIVAVCGAKKPFSGEKSFRMANELGKELALAGFDVVTGVTIGVTLVAALEAKKFGAKVFGVSPAKNTLEHEKKFGYPLKEFNKVNFTGKGVMGRNIDIIESAKAIVFVDGGVGTLNEFSIALQQKKIIGVITGLKGVSGNYKEILKIVGQKNYSPLCFDSSPKKLVKKLSKLLGTL